jgi:hypothetical protein
MPGTVIGISMNIGYPGTYSRNGDVITFARKVLSTDSVGPNFGAAVVLNGDSLGGTYSDAAVSIANSRPVAATNFYGIAVREIKSFELYTPTPTLGNYAPGMPCDAIARGSVIVTLGIPTQLPVAGGAVFIRLTQGTLASPVGGFETAAASDGGSTYQLPGVFWTTGLVSTDINGYVNAEITLTTRNLP